MLKREPRGREPSGRRSGTKGRKDSRDSRESRKYPSRRPVKFQMPKDVKIDYKEIGLLQKFTTDRGKILSRRYTGISAKDQRAVVRALKQARFLGLLPVLGTQS